MEAWGLTDPGLVREQNQDAYCIVPLGDNGLLCVVCDGMGGARSGNVASRLASEVFSEEMKRSFSAEKTPEDKESRKTVHSTLFEVKLRRRPARR